MCTSPLSLPVANPQVSARLAPSRIVRTHAARPADMPLPSDHRGPAIPEMEHFDHDEIDMNPLFNADRKRQHLTHALPLIGALCVAEGLVTPAQIEACLNIQAKHHSGLPLGQILIRFGYIMESELERVLEMQRELKSFMVHALETSSIQLS
jgi:hypothetical protein